MRRGKQNVAEVRAQILNWASRPEGLGLRDDVLEKCLVTSKSADWHIRQMTAQAILFAGKRSHKVVRYFAKIEDAKAYLDANVSRGVTIRESKGWGKDDAAIYPVNADGSPAYKITVAPPPPSRVFRTSTHSVLP